MSRHAPSDPPRRLVLDFSEPMRPKSRARVKIIPASETRASDAPPARIKLYESQAKRLADE